MSGGKTSPLVALKNCFFFIQYAGGKMSGFIIEYEAPVSIRVCELEYTKSLNADFFISREYGFHFLVRKNFHDPFFLERSLFLLKPFLFLNLLVLDDGLEEHGVHVHPGVGLLGHFVNSSLLMQILSRFFDYLICSWRNLFCEHILLMALRISWQSSPNVASAIC
ncbi:hypothetical protein TIFTF001_049889 [Ficus carica]|uniref:Uncharacterized protein n=1 Tax=Ficus carica TaxID=3494 RepID=A0AA87YU88_FICCA|nr:hypothetical protein TIFTF001_049889 [Ficus carica]